MTVISVDVSQASNSLRQAEVSLQKIPAKIPLATSRAINRAVQAGKTSAVREVRSQYTIKAAAVRESMSIRLSKRDDLEGEIVSKGRPRSFTQYRLSPKRDTVGAKRKQPMVAVKKGGALKPLGHFIYKGKVFARLGAKRLPVEHKTGPAVPTLLKNENVAKTVQSTMETVFIKRLDHEVSRLLEEKK